MLRQSINTTRTMDAKISSLTVFSLFYFFNLRQCTSFFFFNLPMHTFFILKIRTLYTFCVWTKFHCYYIRKLVVFNLHNTLILNCYKLLVQLCYICPSSVKRSASTTDMPSNSIVAFFLFSRPFLIQYSV